MDRLALCDVSGLLTDIIQRLSGEDGEPWKKVLAETVRRGLEVFMSFQDLSLGDRWREKGWSSEKDPPIQAGDCSLELISFCEKGHISGKELEKKAKELGCDDLGLGHAEQFLEKQEIIPKSWRKYYLVFPGSVWQDSGGDRIVPDLYWDGDRWCLSFDWLRDDFSSLGRLVRSRKLTA